MLANTLLLRRTPRLLTPRDACDALFVLRSCKVSGAILGLSVSMGLEIEIESGEGTLEIASGEGGDSAGGEAGKKKKQCAGGSSPSKTPEDFVKSEGEDEDDDEDYEEVEADADEDAPFDAEEAPEKESKFKRGVKKAMVKAMGKVKVLAYQMKKYKLSGSVGVGVDLTVMGTGITIEFEVSLSSCLTEEEYQEMCVTCSTTRNIVVQRLVLLHSACCSQRWHPPPLAAPTPLVDPRQNFIASSRAQCGKSCFLRMRTHRFAHTTVHSCGAIIATTASMVTH
jgi:hypothetical protein